MSGIKTKTIHAEKKKMRNERFANQIYGEIKEPVIPKNIIRIWDPPSYLAANRVCRHTATLLNQPINRMLDMRCFYTGIVCKPPPSKPKDGWNIDPRILPWLGTRDHLVPARRELLDCPVKVAKYPSSLVWSSNVANVTLGLCPLLVRLKIRQWLMTIPFDREDTSVESGLNIRWLIIKLINEFRINGRFPWSRTKQECWWYPEISGPFMNRAWKKEIEFLSMNDIDRNNWIKNFNWQF